MTELREADIVIDEADGLRRAEQHDRADNDAEREIAGAAAAGIRRERTIGDTEDACRPVETGRERPQRPAQRVAASATGATCRA